MNIRKLYVVLIIVLIILGIMFNGNKSLAQEDFENYSDAYKEYLELSDEEKAKIDAIPRMYDVPLDMIYEGNNESLLKKVLVNANIITQEDETIPVSYILTTEDTNNDGTVDSKDIKVNTYGGIKILVGNQGSEGLCWDFAAIKSIETNLSINGKYNAEGNPYDFSELHVDYITSNLLNGTRTLHSGGNFSYVSNYIKNEYGVVWEEEVPYGSDYSTITDFMYLSNLLPKVTVRAEGTKKGFVNLPTINKKTMTYSDETLEQFRKTVKKHIMENGSLYATVYSGDCIKYNGIYVLNNKENETNHAISIIGWDDEFPIEKFPEKCRPQKKGAYIALNSWGNNWGNNGMFYISYEDITVERDMAGVDNAAILNLLSIEVKKEPNTLIYKAGDTFDPTGMVLQATDKDGNKKIVTKYTINPETLRETNKYVTISYTEGQDTKTVKQEIRVFTNKYKCGTDLYAFYDEKKAELFITGTGNMNNYENTETPWGNNIKKVVIDNEVSSISKGAFSKCSDLEKLYIYGTNCKIYDNELTNCKKLKIYYKNNAVISNYCQENGIDSLGYDYLYNCGDDITAFLNIQNNKLYIAGSGDTYNYINRYSPWIEQEDKIRAVEIENGINKIGNGFFYNNVHIEQINLSDRVFDIGLYAFYNCKQLKEIVLPKYIEYIHYKTFENCENLENVTLPEYLENIEEYAFKGCSKLKKLESNSLNQIFESAFENCTSLEQIKCNGIKAIDSSAFKNCTNLKNIELSEKTDIINPSVFENCTSLEEIVIPKKINSIQAGVFRGCTNLKSVTMPEGVDTILGYAFENCTSLENIKIPSSVTNLGYYSLLGCDNLKRIYIPETINSVPKLNKSTTIYCKKDSYAHTYAQKYRISICTS